jgi:hypothetical protein
MQAIEQQERSQLVAYINKVMEERMRVQGRPTIRCMHVADKEKLMSYAMIRSPQLERLNLSDLREHRHKSSCSKLLSGCYTTEQSIAYPAHDLLKADGFITRMCSKIGLHGPQLNRLRRFAKTPTRIQTYRLTEEFLERTEKKNDSQQGYMKAVEFVKKPKTLASRPRLITLRLLVTVTPLMSNYYPKVIGGQMFCFGRKAIMFPCFEHTTAGAFVVLDFCTE